MERADRRGVDWEEEEEGEGEGEAGGVVFDFRTEDARMVIFVTGEVVLGEGEHKTYLESLDSVCGRNL